MIICCMSWSHYLFRSYTPSLTPDGRPFPSSLTLTRGPVDFPPSSSSGGQDTDRGVVTSSVGSSSHQASGSTTDPTQHHRGNTFPHNLEFRHVSVSSCDQKLLHTELFFPP